MWKQFTTEESLTRFATEIKRLTLNTSEESSYSNEEMLRHEQNQNNTSVCTQKERQKHMHEICKDVKQHLPWSNSRYLIDHKRKLVFCEVSKSGCTMWKALMVYRNFPALSLK